MLLGDITWSWTLACEAIACLFICHTIATWVYNVYFHPLAQFPGPLLGRSSLLWRFTHTPTGKLHIYLADLHSKHGPIVRVSPNELSFGSAESLKVIYGPGNSERPMLLRSPDFYDQVSMGFATTCIGSEIDPHKHGEMRRMLTPAFSQRSLLEQEAIINGTVDRFVKTVGEKAPPTSAGINMTKWFEMAAFDILGEMAFGESFHSIEDGKPHSWQELILGHVKMMTIFDNLGRIGAITTLAKLLIPASLVQQNGNSRFSRERVEKRLSKEQSRKDFVSLLVEKVRSGEVEKEEMTAHVSTLTIAGGETIATFFSSTTCFLLENPEAMKRMTTEIREAFSTYDSIDASAAQRLSYVQAVISEGLRLFPPISIGLPRQSPGFEIHGKYIPPGTQVYTSFWTVAHDPQNFEEPMKFKPERWLNLSSADIKEASQPFSLGPHSCIGRNFAYMEMSLVLAKLFWSYDLELVNKDVNWLRDAQTHMLWWKPELIVRFHPHAVNEASA